MVWKTHDVESRGSNPRDHAHPPRLPTPYWRRAHRDWRVWFAAFLMLGMMMIYILTDSLAFSPGNTGGQPVPEMTAP
jgi:hypothetical protein